jgi:hypothetical protein
MKLRKGTLYILTNIKNESSVSLNTIFNILNQDNFYTFYTNGICKNPWPWRELEQLNYSSIFLH